MIVAFTIVTSFINNFDSLSSFPNSAKISRVQTVCFQQSSETLSFLRSINANVRIVWLS